MSDLLRLLYTPAQEYPRPTGGGTPDPMRCPPHRQEDAREQLSDIEQHLASRLPNHANVRSEMRDMTLQERVWLDLDMWPQGRRATYTAEYDSLRY